MNIWELPKEHYKWESPITKIYGDIHNEIVRKDEENCIFAIEQAIGYKVDKEELIKALQYDREQYDKGYNDGVRETFVEEIKKIKEEIMKYSAENKNSEDLYLAGCGDGAHHSLAIIDKYITELEMKGK